VTTKELQFAGHEQLIEKQRKRQGNADRIRGTDQSWGA
jgi:hypothetical protein